MFANIVLYKCKNQLINRIKKDLSKEQIRLSIIEEEEEFLKLKERSHRTIIIHDGKERKRVETLLKDINKQGNYCLLFLMSREEAKQFNFRKCEMKNIFYMSRPTSFQELIYFFRVLFEFGTLNNKITEYENIISAFEQAGEFSRKELMTAYESLKAHEEVTELSRKELLHVKDSLQAWEKVSEYSRKELIDHLKEKNAMTNLQEFTDGEKYFLEKVLKAWEHTMELGRQELMKAYDELKGFREECKKDDKK
ncbi:MAG: hypothetical protein KKH98_05425 [Spirochaetes bacterium]|nr:hypothetical protein [Spirochaetota bacterium]